MEKELEEFGDLLFESKWIGREEVLAPVELLEKVFYLAKRLRVEKTRIEKELERYLAMNDELIRENAYLICEMNIKGDS